MHVMLPDYLEEQEGKVPLVRSGIPFWLIADREFPAFLNDYSKASSWRDLAHYKNVKKPCAR